MRVCAALLLVGCVGWMEDLPPPQPEPASDAGAAVEDAGAPLEDAGAPLEDAGAAVEDAGAPAEDAGAPDAGAPPVDAGATFTSVLIAQGRLGRTVLSCDDGLTWTHDEDEGDAGERCGAAPLTECWHHPWAPMGLTQTGDAVVATFGWGAPGMIRRTLDGVTWHDAMPATMSSGVAASPTRVLAGTRTTLRAPSGGAPGAWSTAGTVMTSGVLRQLAYIPGPPGRFLVELDDQVQLSDDDGATWRVTPTPAGCAAPALGILTHQRTVVLVAYSGRVCVSTDRGDSWTLVNVAPAFTTRGVHALGAFFVWNGATRYRSTDGLTWTSAAGTPADVSVGAVAVTSSGTFVAFKGGWRSDYENERTWRSADGVSWTPLPASAQPHGHPITHLISATVRATPGCGL